MIRLLAFLSLVALTTAVSLGWSAGRWAPLARDGLHDPANPSIDVLQEPSEALGILEPDPAGNKVDWVRSLQKGLIQPRPSLYDDREPQILDTTILMTETSDLPQVIFPHKPHSEWMTCETCHESIFVSKIGANPINMGKILDGEYCGLCHGAVSFPLTECNRCHSKEVALDEQQGVADGEAAQ